MHLKKIMSENRSQIKKTSFTLFYLYEVLEKTNLMYSDKNWSVVVSGRAGVTISLIAYKRAFWGCCGLTYRGGYINAHLSKQIKLYSKKFMQIIYH